MHVHELRLILGVMTETWECLVPTTQRRGAVEATGVPLISHVLLLASGVRLLRLHIRSRFLDTDLMSPGQGALIHFKY